MFTILDTLTIPKGQRKREGMALKPALTHPTTADNTLKQPQQTSSSNLKIIFFFHLLISCCWSVVRLAQHEKTKVSNFAYLFIIISTEYADKLMR